MLGIIVHTIITTGIVFAVSLLYPILIVGVVVYKFVRKKPKEVSIQKTIWEKERLLKFIETEIRLLKTKLENEENN